MTIRNTKRLMMALVGVMILLTLVHVGLILWKRPARVDYFQTAMPLFIVVMFAGTWRNLNALEAKHGPDYVQPTPPYARKVLIAVALLAVVLGGVLAYLIVARR